MRGDYSGQVAHWGAPTARQLYHNHYYLSSKKNAQKTTIYFGGFYLFTVFFLLVKNTQKLGNYPKIPQ